MSILYPLAFYGLEAPEAMLVEVITQNFLNKAFANQSLFI